METKLHRIAEKARKEPNFKFTSLYHLLNEELLRGCFTGLRKDAAAGIDKMTKDKCAENLDANLSDLTEQLKRMVCIPQPVRRKYFQGSHKSLLVNITEIVVLEEITIRITDRYSEATNQEPLNYVPNIRER